MKHRVLFPLVLLTICLSLHFCGGSSAADATWNVNSSSSWLTNTNWTPTSAPGSTVSTTNGDSATFGSVISTGRTITVDANRNLLNIDFSGNSSAYTLSSGSLLLSNGGTIQTSGAGSAHTDTISSPLTLQRNSGSYTFTGGSATLGRLLAITGPVSGVSTSGNTTVLRLSGSNAGNNQITGIIGDGGDGGNLAVVKEGAGTWRIGGGNTFSGGITIREGSLVAINSANALGSSSVTLGNSVGGSNNAALLVGSNAFTFANPIVLASNTTGTLTLGTVGDGLNVGTTFTGGVTGTNNFTIDNGADNGLIRLSTGIINNVGTITHVGLGDAGSAAISSVIGENVTSIIQNSATTKLTLSGTNSTFVGTVQIKAGTVEAAGSSSLGGAGASILLGDTSGTANASLQLNLNLIYSRPVTVQAGTSGTLSLNFGGNTDQAGLVTLNNNLVIGNPGSGVSQLSGGTNGTGNLSISNQSIATSTLAVTTNALNHIGTVTNNGSGAATTTISAALGANITGFIQDSATSSTTLSGNNSNFAGYVDILAGTLRSGNTLALNSSNPVSVKSGATFNVNNFNLTIAGLNDNSGSGGTVTNTGGNVRTLTLGGSGSYDFSGAITATTPANLAVTKSGSGTQILSGANSYTGATAVNAGRLLVNGTLASNTVTVGPAGILGGSGTLAGTLSVSGTLSPGSSPGLLTVNNNVTLNNGSAFAAELNGTTAGTLYDQLSVGGSGNLSLTGINNLQLTLGYTASPGDQFTIAIVQGTTGTSGIFEQLNGVTTDLSQGALFTLGAYELAISYRAEGTLFDAGTGNNIMLEIVSVPEPSSAAVLLLTGVGSALVRRRRQ